MKRLLSIILIFTVILCSFCSCTATKDEEKLSIVTTIFPEYDWVKNIIGEKEENIDLTLLVDDGSDLHSYQPGVEDIVKISSCDIFIYIGGESNKWVDDVLKDAVNKEMTVIDLMKVLGDSVKQEEIVEGMQTDGEDDGETEYDEHIWLSLKNAVALTSAITEALCNKDKENEAVYTANYKKYKASLEKLDGEYSSTIKSAKRDTILFGDRFPFRYLTDDYNLNYYAAFVGCSSESEADFKTISFLSDKADELSLSFIITLENSDKKIADTIIGNTKSKNQKIITMNSMQSSVDDGQTYISIMEDNLNSLNKALN